MKMFFRTQNHLSPSILLPSGHPALRTVQFSLPGSENLKVDTRFQPGLLCLQTHCHNSFCTPHGPHLRVPSHYRVNLYVPELSLAHWKEEEVFSHCWCRPE